MIKTFFILNLVALAAVACRSDSSSKLRSASGLDVFIAATGHPSSDKLLLMFSVKKNNLKLRVCRGAKDCLNDPKQALALSGATSALDRNIWSLKEGIDKPTAGKPEPIHIATVDANDQLVGLQRHVQIAVSEAKDGIDGQALKEGLSLIAIEELKAQLTEISSDKYRGRGTGSAENVQVADMLVARLTEFGYQPAGTEGFKQGFAVKYNSGKVVKSANVIAKLEGQDPKLKNEYVVFGAHLDHLGVGMSGEIFNGADDNGSGTIAVLSLAKAIAKNKSYLQRSVLIMFFSGEELGLLGSKHYVKNPTTPMASIRYMMNLDMVGYMRNGQVDMGGAGRVKATTDKLKLLSAEHKNVKFVISAAYSGDSDHAPFFNAGVAGLFFHTRLHANYHQPSDDADLINYEGMREVAQIAYKHFWQVNSIAEIPAAPFNPRNASMMSLHGHSHSHRSGDSIGKTEDALEIYAEGNTPQCAMP